MKKGDIILILIMVFLPLALNRFLHFSPGSTTIRVTSFQNPAHPQISELAAKAGKHSVRGRLGESLIEVLPTGQARFAASPCPNQVCVNTGWVQAPFSVVCIPNGVVIDFPPSNGGEAALQASPPFDGISR